MTWLISLVNLLTQLAKEYDDMKARVTLLETKVQEHDAKLQSASQTGA